MILDNIHNEIRQQLLLKLNTDFSVTGYKKLGTVDIFNDQIAQSVLGKELALVFPVILIEFAEVEYVQHAQNVQKGEALIRFHIGQNLVDYKEKSHKSLSYLDFVHKALQGFKGELFNGLMRERLALDFSSDNVIVHTMEYTTAFIDQVGNKATDLTLVQAELDVRYDSTI